MLIHNLPQELSDDGKSLFLPDYTRAPLGLVDGSRVYAAFRNPTKQHDQGLFISPYHPDCWRDLWRLEIQFRDEIGQLHKLIDIFDQHRIHILHAISRNSFKSRYHVKYFTLDCTRYVSDIDMTSDERYRRSFDDLLGLRYLLQLEFINSIRLLDDGRPRLRISRNLVHLNMAQDLGSKNSTDEKLIAVKAETRIANRRIPLPPEIIAKKDTIAVVTTNAKAQIIYCSFNQRKEQQSAHVVFHFDGVAQRFAHITKRLSQSGLNVIRCQLRQGLLSSTLREKRPAAQVKAMEEWATPFTLNVLIEAQSALNFRDTTIFNKLASIFSEEIKQNHVVMIECRPRDLEKMASRGRS